MKYTSTWTGLPLLLLSALYVTHGEKAESMDRAEKNRGEFLAIETNSELVSSSSGVVQHSDTETISKCSRDGSMCLTCRSVGMCKGGVLTQIPCRGLYPYCDARTGSCTNERKRCKEEERPIVCPGPGFYPDPQSCRSFHVCEGDPLVTYKFACTPLQVYDHEEKKCTRPSFRVRCASFSCFGKQGRHTPYPSDRSIYTMCADAAATELFKCSESEEFDETKQKCIPSCTSDENMADLEDDSCKKYYKCVKSGSKYNTVPAVCSGQRVFDKEMLKCVPITKSFKCSRTSATDAAVTTTLPSSTEEVPVGETEETFLRQDVDDFTTQATKPTSIIAGVHIKEEHILENKKKEKPDETMGITSQTLTAEDKESITIMPLASTQENIDAVASMLAGFPLDPTWKNTAMASTKVAPEETATTQSGTPLPVRSSTTVTSAITENNFKVTTQNMENSMPSTSPANTNNNPGPYEVTSESMGTTQSVVRQTYEEPTSTSDLGLSTAFILDAMSKDKDAFLFHKQSMREQQTPMATAAELTLPDQFFHTDEFKGPAMDEGDDSYSPLSTGASMSTQPTGSLLTSFPSYLSKKRLRTTDPTKTHS